MSSARVTIGGLDVSPSSDVLVTGVMPVAEGRSTAGVNQTHDGQHAPMILVMERAPQPRCPLSLSPWLIITAVVVLGLALSLITLLGERRRHAGLGA